MTISDAFKKPTKAQKLKAIAGHKRMIQMLDNILIGANESDAKLAKELRKGHVKQMNKLIKSL